MVLSILQSIDTRPYEITMTTWLFPPRMLDETPQRSLHQYLGSDGIYCCFLASDEIHLYGVLATNLLPCCSRAERSQPKSTKEKQVAVPSWWQGHAYVQFEHNNDYALFDRESSNLHIVDLSMDRQSTAINNRHNHD